MINAFVDIQVNGWNGVNFSDPELTLDDIRRATLGLAEAGTFAFCPTVFSRPWDVYVRNLPLFARAMQEADLEPHLLGIHLEGPFISAEEGFRGAHPEECLLPPDTAKYDELRELAGGKISVFTLAPELEGAVKLIEHVKRQDAKTVVALGHHNAPRGAIERAIGAGAACATHLGNGVRNMLARHDNPLWTQLAADGLYASFIADGHHLTMDFIKVALKAKGVDKAIITSDASPFAGLPPGEHECGGFKALVEESGRIATLDGKYLAGSGACMLDCMNRLASLGLLCEGDLWRLGRDNALALLGKKLAESGYEGLRGVKYAQGSFKQDG